MNGNPDRLSGRTAERVPRASAAGKRGARRAARISGWIAAGGFVGAALTALVMSGAAGSAATPAPSPAAPSRASPPPTGYADVVRPVMPAVINISSVQVIRTLEHLSPFGADPFFRRFFGGEFHDFVVPRERRSLSLGSGVIVDSDGTALTNYHVVAGAAEVRVTLADGTETSARLVGADDRTDLAVLRLASERLPAAPLGDSDALEVGDVVLAIGNPFGIGQTVTMGIVSAIGRGNIGVADYEDFIQTDAAINPGNSGGALINTRGDVVGISTAILSRSGGYQGIGFAIPSNMARDVLESILKHGRVVRGYAGLRVQRILPDMARAFGLPDTRGALISSLDPRGPAARAGLRPGDVIAGAGGRAIESVEELRTRLSRLKPGDAITLEVVRDGRRVQVDLVLDEPPARDPDTRRRPR